MKTLQLVPHGWPRKLIECPAGLFSYAGDIGFKSEYHANDPEKVEVFCAESGECFWGGTADKNARAALVVQPVILQWIEN